MRFLRRWRSKSPAKPNLDQALVLHLSKSRIPGPRQLKYVGKFLSPLERVIVSCALIVAFGALLFMGVLYYRAHIELLPAEGGTYIEGIVGNPQYINPLYASLNDADADLEKLIFSRLFTRDSEDKIVGDLADSYTVSDGGKTYTIVLKEARWHDGDTLNSDDVAFTFNTILNPDYKSPLRDRFNGVSVKTIDDRTVVFSLSEAYRDFPRLLDFGILPSTIWGAVSPQTVPLAEMNIKPIGSGPYRLKSLTKSKTGTIRSYVLERNEAYYGQIPYIDELTFKFFPSAEEMIAAQNNGQLSGMSYLASGDMETIVAKNSLDYHQSALPELTSLYFNLKSKGVTADLKVRQALSAAIDQGSIVEHSVGRWGIPAKTFIPSFMPGAKDIFSSDPNRVTDLLKSAGWEKIGEQWKKKDLALSVTIAASENDKAVAEAVRSAWQSYGIETKLIIQDAEELAAGAATNRQFEVLLYSVEIPGGDPYFSWKSTSAANLSSWSRKDVDTALEEARLVPNDDEAAKRYTTFQSAALEDIPAIPLFWKAYVYPQNKKVKGFSLSFLDDPSERVSNAAHWYIRTRRSFK